MTEERAVVMRRALSVVPWWITLAALFAPATPAMARVVIAAVLATTVWQPAEGLLLAAGIAPLGAFLAALFDLGAFRLTEAVLLAFIAGWLTRRPTPRAGGPRLPRTATAAAALLAVLLAASVIGTGWQLSRAAGDLRQTIDGLIGSYLTFTDRIGIADAARLGEGLAIAAAAVELLRAQPAMAVRLPAVIASTATFAALTSVLLWFGLAPDHILRAHARIGYRVAAHVADLNAAGSYFVLVLCLALGTALRERGTRRVLWLLASFACAMGVWLAASRTAVAAAVVTIVMSIAWASTRGVSGRVRAWALVGVAAALIAGGTIRARMLEHDPTYRGAGFRTQFAETSLRMLAARPVFGVGIGRYYPDSSLFLSPQLAWTYGAENAHNNFLQIAAETGLVGFALLAVLLIAPIVGAIRALEIDQVDWRLLGSVAGVLGFLGTCLTGHPLLVTEVAAPFWLQFGLAAALGASALLNKEGSGGVLTPTLDERTLAGAVLTTGGSSGVRSRGTLGGPAVTAAAAALIAIGAVATSTPVAPPNSATVTGFYDWEMDSDGARYRWTREYASLFVPGDVMRVEIPMRVPTDNRAIVPIGVEIMTGGVSRGQRAVGTSWEVVDVWLPDAGPLLQAKRIDLKIDRTWRPAIYVPGSADLRSVGVQVGESRLIRAGASAPLGQ